MLRLYRRAALVAAALVAHVCSGPVARCAADEPLTLVVMDPLAAPLSCPCVEGYAQRDYSVLASSLSRRLGRDVRLGFGESLPRGLADAGGAPADMVIGKDSVVRADAAKLGVGATPIARLTGMRGKATQTGLIVVRADDAARGVGDLGGYRVYFGPEFCDEKYAAARRLLARANALPADGECETSAACSDGAAKVVELGPGARAAAVISSYAKPLLEGCGTIQKGDLRVVGATDPVPFVTAFVTDRVDDATAAAVAEALVAVMGEPDTLAALESLLGFVEVDDTYRASVEAAGAPAEPASGPAPADNASWPGWGGPMRTGVAGWLPPTLPERPEIVWRRPLHRAGLGGLAVADGRLLFGDRDIANRMDVWRCLDAATGEPLWKSRYPAPGQLDYDNSPRATPLIADGKAYLLGAFGHLTCVSLATGRAVWRRELRSEYGVDEPLIWGLCSSPLLVDGRLYVNPGADDAAWVALDAETGAEIWRAAGDRHGFASPIVATFDGVRQLVALDRTSMSGWGLATGERLWRVAPKRAGDFNVPTPAVVGDRLLAVSENNGVRLYRVGGDAAPEALATLDDPRPDTSSPIALGDRVFCVWNDLFCVAARDDRLETEWIASDDALPEAGALIAGPTADGGTRLLVIGRGGEVLLVDPDAPQGERFVSRAKPFGDEATDLLTLPAVVGDRLYLRGESEILCLRLTSD